MNAWIIWIYYEVLKKLILILAPIVTVVIIGWGQSSIGKGSQVAFIWSD